MPIMPPDATPVPLFPRLFLGNGQTLGPLYLLSRNNETKIHTKLLSLYYSIYTLSCSPIWKQTMM